MCPTLDGRDDEESGDRWWLERTQCKSPEADTEAEAREEMLLTDFFLHDLLLYSPGPPAQGWYHPQLARPSFFNSQLRKHTSNMPTDRSDRGLSTAVISHVPICVKVTNTI